MRVSVVGGIGTGINEVSGSNQGSGGGGGITTVDASITWVKTASSNEPPTYINGESVHMRFLAIGCANTNLRDSSFKGYGAGA